MKTTDDDDRSELRERILDAAARLIREGGADAATTRAVSAAAGVQAPTIYRFFGDKRGLLDAVAEHEMHQYVRGKATRKPHADPVQDLRRGWDDHVAFGLAHPGVFAILSAADTKSPAGLAGMEVLVRRIQRIAVAGRLRVPVERALGLLQSTGLGVVRTLLAVPEAERDRGLSELARESVITAITGESSAPKATGVRGTALALRASLDETDVLSPGERALLDELLARIARSTT